ncbi:alpha-L-fucosidase [Patella vulgata]|uniref:alpha-L-fucosidase n=1 Tax=Patella vulgata TaxID=6465 RepID=UPI0024A8E4D2|nr:alpha-L-fucosidase [Patella vulgata]
MVATKTPVVNKLSLCILLFINIIATNAAYEPTWESLDSRPLPSWYDEAKLGIFIHWGVFAVPSFRSEWFWYDWQGANDTDCINFMKANYPPGFTYADFAKQYTTEFYSPSQWASIFNASGARYVVLTSKHHEGFTNWPSKYSFNWNSMDNGPHRDLVGELATAIQQNTDLHFGLYHSLFEWFHPLYLQDKANNWTTNNFVKDKTMPELYEIVQKYNPEVVWSDGDWEAPDSYWDSKNFLAWLYNESPVKDTVVTNDRWGNGDMCHHGGYLTCSDKYNPGVLQKRKFENAMTLDDASWGYRRDMKFTDVLTMDELLKTFIETVSCGGNLLMNIGPTKEGTIAPIFQERLLQMGDWLKVNGEAIYSTKPWTYQNDTITPGVWYTSAKGQQYVYATVLNWPSGETLQLGAPSVSEYTVVSLLGYTGSIEWRAGTTHGIEIILPSLTVNTQPSKYAKVFKFTNLGN